MNTQLNHIAIGLDPEGKAKLESQLISEGFHQKGNVWTRNDGDYIQFATISWFDGWIISRSQELKVDLLSWESFGN